MVWCLVSGVRLRLQDLPQPALETQAPLPDLGPQPVLGGQSKAQSAGGLDHVEALWQTQIWQHPLDLPLCYTVQVASGVERFGDSGHDCQAVHVANSKITDGKHVEFATLLYFNDNCEPTLKLNFVSSYCVKLILKVHLTDI